MKFGLTMPNWAGSPDARVLADLAAEAEAAGWHGFFIWDHVFHEFPVLDPWVALTAVALRTTHIHLGALVTPIARRRPIKLARETVTLDHLSGGRLIVGVGIGDGPWEWDYLGEEPSHKVRGDMLDEGLALLDACWQDGRLRHHGPHYRAAFTDEADGDLLFYPGSCQQPRIPVWVAGTWPNKRPFRRAAQWDGVFPLKVGFGPLTPAEVTDLTAYIRQHRTGGEPFDVVVSGWSPGDEQETAVAQVQRMAAVGATWWLESLDPWRYGWQMGSPDWPLADIRRRIRQGPPAG